MDAHFLDVLCRSSDGDSPDEAVFSRNCCDHDGHPKSALHHLAVADVDNISYFDILLRSRSLVESQSSRKDNLLELFPE